MLKNNLVKELNSNYQSFIEENNYDENWITSLILKCYFILKDKPFFSKKIEETDQDNIILRDLLEDELPLILDIAVEMEHYAVINKELPKTIIRMIVQYLAEYDEYKIIELLSKNRKNKGQYFTPEKMVQEIISELIFQNKDEKLNLSENNKITVADFSSGTGNFVLPLLNQENIIVYSIEKDPLFFEYLIFKILFNSNVPTTSKLQVSLTFKLGDSLKGYDWLEVANWLKSKNNRSILQLYTKLRKKLLADFKSIRIDDLKYCLALRKKLGGFNHFNWFIDFPELFIDDNDDFSTDYGVDYVIGNPPWNIYTKDWSQNYNKFLNRSPINRLIYGKYNFALLFAILGLTIAKSGVGLVLPLGILTDTYAHQFRSFIKEKRYSLKIIFYTETFFKEVNNEYFSFILKKEKSIRNSIEILNEKNVLHVSYSSLFSPLFQVPLFDQRVFKEIKDHIIRYPSLGDIAFIRRGFTFTREYKKHYQITKRLEKNTEQKNFELKQIITNNEFIVKKPLEGVYNFQVWYNNKEFVYDRRLLGASGTKDLFERTKLIRRNRGRKLIIGIDLKGYYVNDIFDIIFPKVPHVSVYSLFGYLSSSFAQYFTEQFIQRDITSNRIRQLIVPNLDDSEVWNEIEYLTKKWLNSRKTKEMALSWRNSVDQIINSYFNLSDYTIKKVYENTPLYWF